MKTTIRVNNIKLPAEGFGLADVKSKVSKLIKLEENKLYKFEIVKKAVDARNKQHIFYVCTIETDIDVPAEKLRKILAVGQAEQVKKQEYVNEHRLAMLDGDMVFAATGEPVPGYSSGFRPVVVGFGPAGIFAALILAESGLRPIIIERGKPAEERIRDIKEYLDGGALDTESNVLFGEGGAGAFSDGKLTTGTKDRRIAKVMQELSNAGADKESMSLSKPHIGTDKLVPIIQCLRGKIQSLGGEFRFGTRFTGFKTENSAITAITAEKDGKPFEIDTTRVILAIGHSARDTFKMLCNNGVKLEQKPFSVGVRIEHRREAINRSQYGEFHKHLPAADYKLNMCTDDGRGVYTFCMCPGGLVIPSVNEPETLCINGMSNHARDNENSNAALLVSVEPKDYCKTPEDFADPLFGIEFQRRIEKAAYKEGGENGCAPVTLVGDFLNSAASEKIGSVTPSFKPGYKPGDISKCFDNFIIEALKAGIVELDKKLEGFAAHDAVLIAAETRSSSPVRISRDEHYNSSVTGLYPAGEGSGYAGGIVSSAVDGIKAAEMLCRSLSK